MMSSTDPAGALLELGRHAPRRRRLLPGPRPAVTSGAAMPSRARRIASIDGRLLARHGLAPGRAGDRFAEARALRASRRSGPAPRAWPAGRRPSTTWLDLHRLQVEMALGKLGETFGLGEMGPFRPERADRDALALDGAAQLGDALGLARRLILDRVDADAEATSTPARKRLRKRVNGASPRRGRCRAGRESRCRLSRAGAAVRVAARSLAERARGLRLRLGLARPRRRRDAIGSNVGGATAGLRQMARAAGGAAAAIGQEGLDDAVLERVEGDDDQPAAGRQDALGGERAPSASSSNSRLTAMRSAWKARVAGWISPGLERMTRPQSSARSRVRRNGVPPRSVDDGAGERARRAAPRHRPGRCGRASLRPAC